MALMYFGEHFVHVSSSLYVEDLFPKGLLTLYARPQALHTQLIYSRPMQTSSALINFLYHMLMFPEVQKKIQKELDDITGSGNIPNMAGIQHAKYLKATWMENLRVKPPLPTGTPFYLSIGPAFASYPLGVPHVNLTDDHWKGRFIPKGTIVICNLR